MQKLKGAKQRYQPKNILIGCTTLFAKNKHIDNESSLYKYEGIDSENGRLLNYFVDYIKETALVQRVLVVPDEECEFGNEMVVVKIKDRYFEVFRMFGQGTWTSINLLNEEPDYAYVKL